MVGWLGRTLSFFGGSVGVSSSRGNREIARALDRDVKRLTDNKAVSETDGFDYALELGLEVIDVFGLPEQADLLRSITATIEQLLISNAVLVPSIEWNGVDHNGEEGRQLRLYLERHKRFHADASVNTDRFREGLFTLFASVFQDMPSIQGGTIDLARGFGIRLGDLLGDPQSCVDTLIASGFDHDLQDARLFEDLRQQFERNICAVSGIDIRNRPDNPHRYKMPRDFAGSRRDLFDGYLRNTPFRRLLDCPLPFTIPREARFEHTHIVGGTGHGKTQLLAHLILQDIVEIVQGNTKSVVVIDSQGDLIRKIRTMALFDPRNAHGLADKMVIIDPADIDFPTALNIFHIDHERLQQYGPVERERVFNGAVELYEHFFQGLLGAELTQKQGVAFSYLARLMLELPNATIFTLRDIMDDPEPFKPQIAELSGSLRMFFEREFFTSSFNQTRRQISRRLWGILAIPAFERMFGQADNKVDLFRLLNDGKIILINTSKDLLKTEGSAVFGKFFLAAIAQAIGERAVLPEAERTDTIVYLDEAHEYADASLDVLLTQGRKYRAGVVIAHQFLDQLKGSAKQTLLANASAKIVGGLSHTDNSAFAREMGTTPDFLASLQKQDAQTEFGLWIKHHITEALRLSVPFGLLESAVRLDEDGERLQREFNRDRYCVPRLHGTSTVPAISAPPVHETANEGRGGTQHRELQQMIKGLGHDFGFGAVAEAPCEHSRGAIDVLLSGEKRSIAIEISISTSPEHEVGNLRKCLGENVDDVLCVSPTHEHRLAIQNLALQELSHPQAKRIAYLHPSDVRDYLEQHDERETTLIRGYEVVTKTVPSSPEDVEYRLGRIRQALANK